MLELFDTIGRATLQSLWWPVLLWTVVALPLYGALRLRWGTSTLTQYWGRVGLLMSLPLSLLLGATGWRLPQQAVQHTVGATGLEGTVMTWTATPVVSAPEAAMVSAAWQTPFVALGLLTVFAVGVALWRVGRLGRALWLLRQLRRALPPVRRPVQYSSLVPVPLTFGWWRPRIVLPIALRNEPEAAALALAHEAVHVRRRDYAVLLATRLIAAVAAVHPLVLLLHRDLNVWSEKACDAAVLARPDIKPAAYARLLLRFGGTTPQVPAPALAFGRPTFPSSSATLTQRLRAMTSAPSPTSPKRSLCAALTLALLATALAFLPAQSTKAQPAVDTAFDTAGDALTLPTVTPPAPAPASSPPPTPAVQDTPPEPVGGMQAIQEQVRYPEEARAGALQGTLKIAFLVTADGQVSDIEIQQSAAAVLDYEIVRVLLNTDFKPATRNGEPFTADITFPVTFVLQGGQGSDIEPISTEFDEEAIETQFTLDQVVVTGLGV